MISIRTRPGSGYSAASGLVLIRIIWIASFGGRRTIWRNPST
jgi:hypothetical protein